MAGQICNTQTWIKPVSFNWFQVKPSSLVLSCMTLHQCIAMKHIIKKPDSTFLWGLEEQFLFRGENMCCDLVLYVVSQVSTQTFILVKRSCHAIKPMPGLLIYPPLPPNNYLYRVTLQEITWWTTPLFSYLTLLESSGSWEDLGESSLRDCRARWRARGWEYKNPVAQALGWGYEKDL